MIMLETAFDAVAGDVFAEALMDQGATGKLLVERAGGGLHATSLHWWLRRPGEPDPVDFAALDIIRSGPVLDLGCATGRHVEALAARGLAAEGIDMNPAAVALGRLHGCDVRYADFWTFRTPRQYRWVLALGNNLGIAGRLANLPRFLHRLADLLEPGGEVLLSSVDWRQSGARSGASAAADRDPGEMRLRHHYAGEHGPWFDWLYVTPETLAIHAADAGFTCDIIDRFDEVYIAVLRRARVG